MYAEGRSVSYVVLYNAIIYCNRRKSLLPPITNMLTFQQFKCFRILYQHYIYMNITKTCSYICACVGGCACIYLDRGTYLNVFESSGAILRWMFSFSQKKIQIFVWSNPPFPSSVENSRKVTVYRCFLCQQKAITI